MFCMPKENRNTSAREKWILKNATACSSHLPNSTVMQQSSSLAQAQSFSQPRTAVSTSTKPSIVPNTTSNPHATMDSFLALDLSYLSRVYRRSSSIYQSFTTISHLTSHDIIFSTYNEGITPFNAQFITHTLYLPFSTDFFCSTTGSSGGAPLSMVAMTWHSASI